MTILQFKNRLIGLCSVSMKCRQPVRRGPSGRDLRECMLLFGDTGTPRSEGWRVSSFYFIHSKHVNKFERKQETLIALIFEAHTI